MIKDKFVVVGVAMEKRDPQGLRVLLERPRQKAADDGSRGDKRRMRAGRKMGAMAHDGAYVPHVDLPCCEITLPSDNIDRVEWIENAAELIVHLDPDFPLAVVLELRGGLRCDDDRRIVQRMLSDQPFVGLLELRFGLDDQEEVVLRFRHNAIGDRTRNIDVVSRLERERPEIRFDNPLAAVDKIQLVAVSVAVVERHWLG